MTVPLPLNPLKEAHLLPVRHHCVEFALLRFEVVKVVFDDLCAKRLPQKRAVLQLRYRLVEVGGNAGMEYLLYRQCLAIVARIHVKGVSIE